MKIEKSDVELSIDNVTLGAFVNVPLKPKAVVIFAHGSGSSRFSPRNNLVASVLNKAGIATVLADLLTGQEDSDYQTRFNINLLTKRLAGITKWVGDNTATSKQKIGYFGASTGAAAALDAAAQNQNTFALVSRGGRPDLSTNLTKVLAPTLLIIGGNDQQVIELNRLAYAQLRCPKQIKIVAGATHLFEESGALEQVAEMSKQWFLSHL